MFHCLHLYQMHSCRYLHCQHILCESSYVQPLCCLKKESMHSVVTLTGTCITLFSDCQNMVSAVDLHVWSAWQLVLGKLCGMILPTVCCWCQLVLLMVRFGTYEGWLEFVPGHAVCPVPGVMFLATFQVDLSVGCVCLCVLHSPIYPLKRDIQTWPLAQEVILDIRLVWRHYRMRLPRVLESD